MVTEYKTFLFLVYLIAQQPLQLTILTRKNDYIYNAVFRFLWKSLSLLTSSVCSWNFASNIFFFSLLFSCFLAIIASIGTLVVTWTFFWLSCCRWTFKFYFFRLPFKFLNISFRPLLIRVWIFCCSCYYFFANFAAAATISLIFSCWLFILCFLKIPITVGIFKNRFIMYSSTLIAPI